MFDIGFLELILVGVIGLIVLGPERLPVAARTLGRWVGNARRMMAQISQEIEKQVEIEELKAELKKQGESLNVNEDIKQIQQTVSEALKDAERHSEEFEQLPRTETDRPFSSPVNSLPENTLSVNALPERAQTNTPPTSTDK